MWRDLSLRVGVGCGEGELLKALGKGGKGGEEGRERARCVRQVYVGPASEPPYAIRHLDAGLISASASVTDTRTKAQTKAPNAKKYLARLLHVVEHCLPHLYVLEWNLPGLLGAEVGRAMRGVGAGEGVRVRCVRVWNGVFGERFLEMGNGENGEEDKWALESLAIEGWSTFASPGVLVRLLCAVAPTLREFVWKGHLLGPVLLPSPPSFVDPADDDCDCDNSNNDNDGKLPDFPHLRSVVLDRASPDCTLLLQHLVGENTRVSALALDSATSSTSSFLRSRGYVSSLTSFAWANTRAAEGSEGEESVLAFLKENAQIEKFEVTAGVDAGWAEGALLPLLRSFQSLTSLKMVFSAEDVPESSLSALAALSNLRTLCIAAGPAYPASPSWYPEHEVMGRVLAPMKELRRLVVMRDTYEVKAHALAPRREGGGGYYRVRTVPEGVEVEEWLTPAEVEVYRGTGAGGEGICLDIRLDDASYAPSLGLGSGVSSASASGSDGGERQREERRREREVQGELAVVAWERWHAAQMRIIVQSYAEAFGELEWCFVGQLAFGMENVYDKISEEGQERRKEKRKEKRRVVYPEEERRDPGGTTVERRMSVACWRPA